MAIIRAELQGKGTVRHQKDEGGNLSTVTSGVFDGIAETAADLLTEQVKDFAPGSIIFCLSDHKLYVKTGAGEWEEAEL